MSAGASDPSTTLAVIRELAVFGMLDEQETASLAGVFSTRHYSRGAVVYEEGKAAREFFIIADGQVDLSKRLGRLKRDLGTLEKNSILGHLALIDQGVNESTATAASDVLVLVLDRSTFGRMAASASPVALKLMVPLVTACCRCARWADGLVHGLYDNPQATLLTLHTG